MVIAGKLLNCSMSTMRLLLASGLYALAEGIGVLLFRRERGGVVMLIWAIIGGVGWLVVR